MQIYSIIAPLKMISRRLLCHFRGKNSTHCCISASPSLQRAAEDLVCDMIRKVAIKWLPNQTFGNLIFRGGNSHKGNEWIIFQDSRIPIV